MINQFGDSELYRFAVDELCQPSDRYHGSETLDSCAVLAFVGRISLSAQAASGLSNILFDMIIRR